MSDAVALHCSNIYKSHSFDIIVVVNVYKLYSTCIKKNAFMKKKQNLCKLFHYFFKGDERKCYAMGEKINK